MQTTPEIALLRQVETALEKGVDDSSLLEILDKILAHFHCPVGSIHRFDPISELLVMGAHRGLPAVIMDKVTRIPIGKGMAGLAAERKEPVQVCNLQTDTSGAAKPGARSTQMEGSIAVPLLVEKTDLRGVLGVAKPVSYEFTKNEQDLLLQLGSLIGKHLGLQTRQQVLDQYFMDARSKLIDIAAFLDRVDRAHGDVDFRLHAFRDAMKSLEGGEPNRARNILRALSDPTADPINEAPGKSACGAWPGKQ
jgi:L-methionine (R)-S-oxide reductase